MEYSDKASSAQLNHYLKSILDYLCNVLLCVHRQLVVKGAHLAGETGSSIIIACERPHVGELFRLVWKGRVIDDVPVEHIELVHLHQVQVGLQHRLCDVVSVGVSNNGENFFLYRMSSTCLCQGGLHDVQNVESRGLECRSQQTGRMCPLCFATKLDQDN